MTANEILKLLDAGYTKDEISAMLVNQEQLPAEQPAAPGEQPAEQPEEQPEAPAENNDSVNAEVSALREELSSTRKQLNQLVKQMQSSNLKTASVNILPEADLERKTDEAMAELIRPSYEKGEKN